METIISLLRNEGRLNPTSLSPRDKKAVSSISAAFLQSIAKVGAQGTVWNRRKTLHELPAHFAQKVAINKTFLTAMTTWDTIISSAVKYGYFKPWMLGSDGERFPFIK
jgi:hypothetical protein